MWAIWLWMRLAGGSAQRGWGSDAIDGPGQPKSNRANRKNAQGSARTRPFSSCQLPGALRLLSLHFYFLFLFLPHVP